VNLTLVRTLSKSEQSLIMQTRPKELDKLDEDQLADLHDRVRRARTKYSKLYRQQASAKVRKDRARGKASAKASPDRDRTEVFEDALARVSRRLARAARASADELRTQRLAAVKAAKAGKGKSKKTAGGGKASGKGRQASKAKTPISKKSNASGRATKARKQAKRDAR
jgi:hypothetical protein